MDELNKQKGEVLRDEGISKAVISAETNKKGWSELAYGFLVDYVKTNSLFMAEEVRAASFGVVPLPQSNRAWGGIFVSAKNNKLIRSIGFGLVKNPKAHRTPATLWARETEVNNG